MQNGAGATPFEFDRVLAMCVSPALSLFPHDMYQLTDPAIEAILKEWRPQKYYPPYTDVQEWIHSIESLCTMYGVPDAQQLQCAIRFIKEELGTELRKVLADARVGFELLHWNQFKSFLVAFDRK